MSFSLFPKRYKPLWQVIITKYSKELYNRIYEATDYMLDIRNKTQTVDLNVNLSKQGILFKLPVCPKLCATAWDTLILRNLDSG